ncbi:PLP-dependent aminotransferase family protein, partial [Photobacterium sanctipauli]
MSQASIPNRYSDVIERVKYQIRQKVWLPGERVPSIRKMSRLAKVSPATVTKAYELLEVEGWIYAKPQSGYYVAAHFNQLEPSSASGLPQVSNQAISINRHVFDVLKAIKQPDVIPFGSAFPDPVLFPVDELGRRLSRVIKSMPLNSGVTDLPPGCLELRRVIAQRYANEGLSVSADDIVITTGATEALGVSLAAVTQPGDTVVIESPAFYGALQAIERFHLKAIELPLGDGGGVDIDALANIVEQHDVKACWFMSKFQNPSATTMTIEQLTLIYQLLAAKQIPLIEDDVYSELYFGSDKPPSFKSIDEHGLVLHCSSF